jgi:hypothetical protein
MQIPQGNSLCSYLYLKQTKMSCFSFYLFFSAKSESRKEEQVLLGRSAPVGGGGCGERVQEGEYGANAVYTGM